MHEEIQLMAEAVEPFVSDAANQKIRERVLRWQAAVEKQTDIPAAAAPLPLLVKKSQGLPTVVDPFYFSLKKDAYAQQ